jgi:hypothetical protein
MNLLFPRPPKRMHQATGEAFSPQKRTSSTLKYYIISLLFLFLWVTFALLDPDPDPATQINADTDGSGSETLSASNYLEKKPSRCP